MRKVIGTFSFSLFLGTLIGLSSVPSVGAFITTLTGLLGIVLGLRGSSTVTNGGEPEAEESASRSVVAVMSARVKTARVDFTVLGSFGIAALVGVFLGLYVRTAQPWHPSPAELHSEWASVELPKETVGQLIVYQTLGLLPNGWSQASSALDLSIRSPVLFSVDVDELEKMDPDNFGDVVALGDAWSTQGGLWRRFHDAIAKVELSADAQMEAYRAVWLASSE
ncbi:MAG: hypothetical protein K0U72_18005 [Gammaproteobacteria bacterium]|nr:hypothetical protein [Gammaproteobacteria bacterium]